MNIFYARPDSYVAGNDKSLLTKSETLSTQQTGGPEDDPSASKRDRIAP